MGLFEGLVAALACGVLVAEAATPVQWRSRSVYQVLTDRFARSDGSTTATCNTGDRAYCGGTYRGIIDKLDYIQGMGFSAVWISPVVKNFEGRTASGTSYHGFWQQDLYSLNPHFGNEDDLKALSSALHKRGMYLMVDVVANHFGWPGNAQSVDYSKFNPFNDAKYFHPYCVMQGDSNQDATEDCWLGDSTVELVDVKTEDLGVVVEYQKWIKQLVSNYSIDGLRVDTVKHVDKAFWPDFGLAAGVYCLGEVFQGDPIYTFPFQSVMDGVLNFPLYYPLTRAFQSTSGNMGDLVSMINRGKSECKDSSLLGTFSENHDIPRFASVTQDLSLARNVIAVTMLADGIPIIYGGQEHQYRGGKDPDNREAVWLSGYNTNAPLYKMIASLNKIRSRAISLNVDYLSFQNWVIYSDSNTMVMRKGFDGRQIVGVFSNKGSGGNSYTLSLKGHGYASGAEVVEVLSCASATVNGNGTLPVPMAQGLPRVYFPAAQLKGSGICSR